MRTHGRPRTFATLSVRVTSIETLSHRAVCTQRSIVPTWRENGGDAGQRAAVQVQL